MSDLYTLALRIAKKAHMGQVDKGGVDYIQHPLYVASQMVTDEEKAVALLHDVIEDSSCTLASLTKSGLPQEVIEAVDILTKKPLVDDAEYFSAIKANELARVVKLADLKHNSDLSRIPEIGMADFERIDKYAQAITFLESV